MKTYYLLDTNIISELMKPLPVEKVIDKIIKFREYSCISAVTWAEALYGIKHMPEGKRKTLLLDFYLNAIASQYQIIPFDEHASLIYSDIKSRLENIGKPAQELDLQIASTAIANNLILITRNISDFDGILQVTNLMTENWFS